MSRQYVYPTPNTPTESICRCLVLPVGYMEIVADHLQKLADPEMWEADGTVTPGEAAAAMEAALDSWLFRECFMIGEIKLMAYDTLPPYMLVCDGSVYAKADYLELWLLLDPEYEVDPDHFRVPNLAGRVPIGAGDAGPLGVLTRGDQVGEYEHTLTVDEMPAHTHEHHKHTIDIDVEGDAIGIPQTVPGPGFMDQTGSTGGDQAHNNVQPSEAVVYAIVARYP